MLKRRRHSLRRHAVPIVFHPDPLDGIHRVAPKCHVHEVSLGIERVPHQFDDRRYWLVPVRKAQDKIVLRVDMQPLHKPQSSVSPGQFSADPRSASLRLLAQQAVQVARFVHEVVVPPRPHALWQIGAGHAMELDT